MVLDYDIPSTNMNDEQINTLSSYQATNGSEITQTNNNIQPVLPKPMVTGGEKLND